MLAVLAGCCTAIAAEDKTASPPSAKGKPAVTWIPVDGDPFAPVRTLTPSQVFEKVKDSVVVVKTYDANGKTIGQGSGVMLPSGKIGTNCHVLKNGTRFHVGGGKQFVPATLWGSDEDKDICLLEAKGLTAKSAQLGQATHLKVGEPVYAVGAPQGLELSLSNGIVSQLRGGSPPFIQTTAAISPGSSGGGLFDELGRLVGFTTLYIEGGQSLNFAMPVEWAREIQPGTKVAQGRSTGDWNKRASALQSAGNWPGLRDWSEQWTLAQPGNVEAWTSLAYSYEYLQRYTESIEAYRQVLRINPEIESAWFVIGLNYSKLERHSEAIEAYRHVLRTNPAVAWPELGYSYLKLKRYTEAIEAYRQRLRIDPNDAITWYYLGLSYSKSGNRAEALVAVQQLRRLNPAKADELFNLIVPR